MPEHLRALIAIMFFALPTWMAAQKPFVAGGSITEAAYRSDRTAWISVTLIAFLSHNFWLFLILTAFFVRKFGRTHDLPIAMYCLLLCALPPDYREIPGIGPLDHLMTIDYYRTLSLFILTPSALFLYKTREERAQRTRPTDVFAFGLLLWIFIVRAMNEAPVHVFRAAVYSVLDVALPYYVASRSLQSMKDFRRLATVFVVVTVIMSIIAVFESTRHWLLYSSLPRVLGAPDSATTYLLRSEGGALRAKVSVGNPIVLGYVIMIGLGMATYLRPLIKSTWQRRLVLGIQLAGLIATLSRGPWVGAAAMYLVLFALGPGLVKRLAMAIFGGGTAVLLLLISPWGDVAISYLPFIGDAESGTVDYRTKLFEVSMIVFKQHPIVGDLFYLRNPIMEQMRQGEGIIDMVNTYLAIAMPFGTIGLLLFVGVFWSSLRGVQGARKSMMADPEYELLGRVLLGAMLGILVTIGTVSPIGVIPILYWLCAGLCVSFMRIAGMQSAPSRVLHGRKPPTRSSASLKPPHIAR